MSTSTTICRFEHESEQILAFINAIQHNDVDTVVRMCEDLANAGPFYLSNLMMHPDLIDECAKNEVSELIYERIVLINSSNKKFAQHKDNLSIACKSYNKSYLNFIHKHSHKHHNFFVIALLQQCNVEMLEWIIPTFGMFPANTKALNSLGYNDFGSCLQALSLIKNNDELLTYCFHRIIDQIQQMQIPNMNLYLFNFAVDNRNFKLILLMDSRQLLQSIKNFHTHLFLDAHQYFYETGRVQIDDNFFEQWNNAILCFLLRVQTLQSYHYNELIDKLYTSKFWRDVFIDHTKTSSSLTPPPTLLSPISTTNCLIQVIQKELYQINQMQRYCKHITSTVLQDIVDWVILPMICVQ
jgi:hypothetical protein